jgi:SAM-dependent methyltransferase
MITTDDLSWWLDYASVLEWTFAKTYAGTAPHHYVVAGRTSGVSHVDMVRAARVIHTFGQPGKYYSLTKIYLVSPDGKYRWWTEDNHFPDTTLVNRGTTELSYGVQNALSSASRIKSSYDTVATTWDVDHPMAAGEADHVRALLSNVRGTFAPHVLDLGCGTGRVLDLGLATADRYAAVDSSQGMLNVLLHKHPKVAAAYPVDVREALATRTFTPGQFDWVVLDAAVELTAEQHAQVRKIARLAVITHSGDEWKVQDVARSSLERILASAAEMRSSSRITSVSP